MLREVDPEGVVKAVSLLASEAKRLHIGYEEALKAGATGLGWEPQAAAYCFTVSETILGSAQALNMVGVERATERLRGWIVAAMQKGGELSLGDIKVIADGLGAVVVGYGDELDGRRLFAMTPRYAKYYSPEEPVFGSDVFAAFPAANDDIANAGKCLALGCGTACVMHLMRALEVGLKAIAKELGVENKNDWGTYLRDIEAEFKRREKAGGKRSPDEQFYAEACSHFGNLKVAFRNPTMHVGSEYSEDRAEEILLAARSFMRHLAPRFSEKR